MRLLYAMVARGTLVLAEFSLVVGNANTIARRILEKLSTEGDTRVSYTQDGYVFHIYKKEGLVFLCMADAESGRRIPFAFLEDISLRFLKTYKNLIQNALAYAMNDEFSRVLTQQMEFFNNPNSDQITRMRTGLNEAKNVMVESIDKVLERGERIELLVEKASLLTENTVTFRRQARTLQRALWWKNVKLVAILAIIVTLGLYLVLSFFCGGPFLNSCR